MCSHAAAMRMGCSVGGQLPLKKRTDFGRQVVVSAISGDAVS